MRYSATEAQSLLLVKNWDLEQDLKTVIDKEDVLSGEFTELSSKLKELEE